MQMAKSGQETMMDLRKVKDLSDWPRLRSEIEAAVLQVLGEMPGERIELQVKVFDETHFEGYTRKRVNYFVDEWTRVSAWLFVPDGKDELPAIVCCHRDVPQGKDESAGIEGDPHLAFARQYAELGYVTLAPDCLTAGERIGFGLQPYDTSNFCKDCPRMSPMGKMLWDHMQAVDVLCETKHVDSARVGVVGHGFGGVNALMLAAFDERIQACVASCAFTRFADDPHPERWVRNGEFACLPKLADAVKTGKFPFDWEHILALAAPSPVLLLTARKDARLPNTRSCEKAVRLARRIYEPLGEPDALQICVHDEGSTLTPRLLQLAAEWFERWL